MPRWPWLLVFATLLAMLAWGCDGDNDEDAPTATPSPVSSATPQPGASVTASASPGGTATTTQQNIRDVDLTQEAEVQRLLTENFGEVVDGSIIYADLTRDGAEEAIVPISSGGTAGNVAYVVYGYRDGALTVLLSKDGLRNVQLSVEDDRLVEQTPEYAPGDPNCCPSQFRIRRYVWNGDELFLEEEGTVPATPAS
jgi:hypothetical protein